MKKLITLALSLLVTTVLFSQSALAQETVNPGEDPNLEIRSQGAGVGAVGFPECPECELRNLANAAINANTTFKQGAKTGPDGESTSAPGTR